MEGRDGGEGWGWRDRDGGEVRKGGRMGRGRVRSWCSALVHTICM